MHQISKKSQIFLKEKLSLLSVRTKCCFERDCLYVKMQPCQVIGDREALLKKSHFFAGMVVRKLANLAAQEKWAGFEKNHDS